jgi:hypothetical protein
MLKVDFRFRILDSEFENKGIGSLEDLSIQRAISDKKSTPFEAL